MENDEKNTAFFLDSATQGAKKMQLIELLNKQINRFTMGESTSVTLEKADDLSKSILFCISAYVEYDLQGNSGLAINTTMEKMFLRGRQTVFSLFEQGKLLLTKAKETMLGVKNISYIDTYGALEVFFKKYDIYFMAHDVPCMIDYQLFQWVENKSGIAFINEYLNRLIAENLFCLNFPEESIIRLLKLGCADYRLDLINIFQIVFNNAVALEILGDDVAALVLSATQLEKIRAILSQMNEAERTALFEEKLNSLVSRSHLHINPYKNYYYKAAEEILSRITLVGNSGLGGIFICG